MESPRPLESATGRLAKALGSTTVRFDFRHEPLLHCHKQELPAGPGAHPSKALWPPLFPLAGRHRHHHQPPFNLGPLLDDCILFKVLLHPLQQLCPELLMGHFTSPEAQRDLYLIAILKKPLEVTQLDLVVTGIRTRAEFHFLDLDLFLLFLCCLLLFRLLELPFAKIHDAADGRIRIRIQFDQIKFCGGCPLQGIIGGYNADLFTVLINQTNLRDLNLFVNAPVFTGAGLLTARPRLSAYSDPSILQQCPTQTRNIRIQTFDQCIQRHRTQILA